MKRLLGMMALALSVGCGSGTKSTGGGPIPTANANILVTINGSIVAFPAGEPQTPSFQNLTVSLLNPVTVLANPTAPPLGSAALGSSQCTPSGCAYSIADVNIYGANLGLVTNVTAADPNMWVPTYTGTITAAVVESSSSATTSLQGNPAFVMNPNGLVALATLAGKDPNDFVATGALVGIVVGKAAEASAATGNQPPPIAGATVAATGDPNVAIVYPNATFTGTQQSTSSTGIFIASPSDMLRPVIAPWAITAAAADTGHTWPAITAGSTPGLILIVPFEAQP